MLTSEQSRIIADIMNNKDLFLSMAQDNQNYSRIKGLYDNLTPAFKTYYNDLLDEAVSRAGYLSALKSHKVDPAIAGGLGQGIAGIGGGIYAAANTAVNNAKIDASREYYKKEVFNASATTSLSEKKLLSITEPLDSLLDSIESIKNHREKEVEELYQKAKTLSSNIFRKAKIQEAIKIYQSIESYKDSKTLLKECISNKKISRQLIIALISLVLAIIAACGMSGDGAVPMLLISLIVFLMTYIMLQFMIK